MLSLSAAVSCTAGSATRARRSAGISPLAWNCSIAAIARSAAAGSPDSSGRVSTSCKPGLPAANASARIISFRSSTVSAGVFFSSRHAASHCLSRSVSDIGCSGTAIRRSARSWPQSSGNVKR